MPAAGTRNKHDFPQLQLYQRCLDTFGSNHSHMAFIDSDEVRAAPPPSTNSELALHATPSSPSIARVYGSERGRLPG